VESAKRLDVAQQANALARAEALRKALEEVIAAREAAKAAEEQRLAAVKAADEATKAAEAAISAKREAGDATKVAALPKLEKPAPSGPFDGTWTIHQVSATCMNKSGSFVVTVAGTKVGGRGRISSSGDIQWTSSATVDGAPMDWSGTLRGGWGSGTYSRRDGKCGGTFTARRN
jgi:hypothetical protein